MKEVNLFILENDFRYVIPFMKDRVVVPQLARNSFFIEIDDYYMGTIINPRLINHGKIEPDNRTKEMSFTSKSMTDGHKRFMDSFSHTYKFDKSKRWKSIKTFLEVKKPEPYY